MDKKVVIIDDDELFRAGLTRLIDSFDNFKVKLNISSSDFMERSFKNEGHDLVLLSPPFFKSEGVKVCELCVRAFTPCPVMIFSNFFSKYTVMKSLECGVSAYYTKRISPYDLEDIMVEMTSRENFSDIKMEPQVRAILVNDEVVDFAFSEAEEEVLRLVCQQKSSAEISDDLGISVRTVESRKRNMMLKTQSKNMIGVVMIFMKSNRFQSQKGPGE